MSGVLELILVLAATFAVVWLPGAIVIKAAAWLRPRHKETPPSYPTGPAMDL
jgi:hypothetical protein